MIGIVIDWGDVPSDIQREMLKINKRKRPKPYIKVDNDCVASVGGPSYDYSRKYLVGFRADGETHVAASGYYESYVNFTDVERLVYHGGKIPIPANGAIMEYDTGRNSPFVIIHVGPAHPLATLALRLGTGEKLDEVERAVLGFYGGLNSAGRKDALSRYRIPRKLIDIYTKVLAEKGLVKVNKNGAVRITTDGRNAHSANPSWDWYKFSYDKELRQRVLAMARERMQAEEK